MKVAAFSGGCRLRLRYPTNVLGFQKPSSLVDRGHSFESLLPPPAALLSLPRFSLATSSLPRRSGGHPLTNPHAPRCYSKSFLLSVCVVCFQGTEADRFLFHNDILPHLLFTILDLDLILYTSASILPIKTGNSTSANWRECATSAAPPPTNTKPFWKHKNRESRQGSRFCHF